MSQPIAAVASLVGRSHVLGLYRSLLKSKKALELTDKAYFSKRVRMEFERRRNEKNPAKIKLFIAVRPSIICSIVPISAFCGYACFYDVHSEMPELNASPADVTLRQFFSLLGSLSF
jgi:hypothetical protein